LKISSYHPTGIPVIPSLMYSGNLFQSFLLSSGNNIYLTPDLLAAIVFS